MTWDEQRITMVLATPLENMRERTGGRENRYLIYRMLQAMFERQTSSEQRLDVTVERNHIGFSAADARLLSDVAKRSQPYKTLTAKQAVMVARRLSKYTRQLADVAASKQMAQQVLPMSTPVLVVAIAPAVLQPPKVVCSYCGDAGHKQEDCDKFWGDEFGRYEDRQEKAAYDREYLRGQYWDSRIESRQLGE